MEYSYFLYQVGNYTWLGYILAFAFVFALGLANRSYGYSAVVLVVSNLIMQVVEPALVAYASEHKALVRAIWYPIWTAFYVASIFCIFVLHKKSRCNVEFVAISLVYAFAALGVLQILRYFDYLVFSTDYLRSLYRYGVNAVNIGCVFILLVPIWNRRSKRTIEQSAND